jgi:hypothetical protein
MSDAATVRPFSNGSQYGDWTDSNCATCRKAAKDGGPVACEIELALVTAYVGDGVIPLGVADRMGRDHGRYVWPCMEHDPPFVNVRADGTVDPAVPRPTAGPPS